MHMFGILSWILVMLAPEEILILGGAKYKMAVWLIAPMVSGTLFRFYSYIILLLVQGILEHKITGMVIVPLHKTVLIAIAYGAINLLSMNLYRVAWYYRYAVMILVVGAAAIALRKQMMAVLKMFKKK